jgi:Gluconate 2-dehydrogenase subunit 3
MFAELPFTGSDKCSGKTVHDQTAITKELSGREFFELMRKHTLEGFFSEPSTKATATRWVGMVLGFVG